VKKRNQANKRKTKNMKAQNPFASAGLTAGQLNAVVKTLGGHDAALKLLRGELVVSTPPACKWSEQNNIIYFDVVHTGKTNSEWVDYFDKKGVSLGFYAKSILLSSNFQPTEANTVARVAVLKGARYNNESRTNEVVRSDAGYLTFMKPNVELVCLILDMFSFKDFCNMDLMYVIVMHNPVDGMPSGNPDILGVAVREESEDVCMYAGGGKSTEKWGADFAFAFEVA
jgi:hypothetical protein